MMKLILLFTIAMSTVVASAQFQRFRASDPPLVKQMPACHPVAGRADNSRISRASPQNSPKIGKYSLGDVITNEVCISRSRRFDRGIWTGSISWEIPYDGTVFGFSKKAYAVSDVDGRAVGFTLRDTIVVDPSRDDVRKVLIDHLLKFQKIIVQQGGFDPRLLGTNSISGISLKGNSAYDIHQHLRFADAFAEIYACYRSCGPFGHNTVSCEFRLKKPRNQAAASNRQRKAHAARTQCQKIAIGKLCGYELGQSVDREAVKGRHVLSVPMFGCPWMQLSLSKKNRIWEISFDNSGVASGENSIDSLMQVFLRYQKAVVDYYKYPEDLLGKDNTYLTETYNAKRGRTKYYITQWFQGNGGRIQVTMNAGGMEKDGNIKWDMNVRAVNFKVDKDDEPSR